MGTKWKVVTYQEKTQPYGVKRDANFILIVPPNILRVTSVNPSVEQCPWRDMMTSSNENIFHVTGTLWGESIGHRWIPLKNDIHAELWCFFICAWTNGWTNNRDAGDLRRHHAHYDVTVTETGYVAFKPSDFTFYQMAIFIVAVIISLYLPALHELL